MPRPRRFTPNAEAYASEMVEPNASRRTLLNAAYRREAMRALQKQSGVAWVLDPNKRADETTTRGGGYQRTILTEMGRYLVANDHSEEAKAQVVAWARELNEKRPTVREAVRLIRNVRQGGPPPGFADDLVFVVLRALEEYQRTHDVTPPVLAEAWATLRAHFERPAPIKPRKKRKKARR